jgi:hypothetical protein
MGGGQLWSFKYVGTAAHLSYMLVVRQCQQSLGKPGLLQAGGVRDATETDLLSVGWGASGHRRHDECAGNKQQQPLYLTMSPPHPCLPHMDGASRSISEPPLSANLYMYWGFSGVTSCTSCRCFMLPLSPTSSVTACSTHNRACSSVSVGGGIYRPT